MRRMTAAGMLPALVLAGAVISSPFAGTTTQPLTTDRPNVTHSAPPKVQHAPSSAGQHHSKPAWDNPLRWHLSTGSAAILGIAYGLFGGLAAITLMLIARHRGRSVREALPEWGFWRGMTQPIGARRGSRSTVR